MSSKHPTYVRYHFGFAPAVFAILVALHVSYWLSHHFLNVEYAHTLATFEIFKNGTSTTSPQDAHDVVSARFRLISTQLSYVIPSFGGFGVFVSIYTDREWLVERRSFIRPLFQFVIFVIPLAEIIYTFGIVFAMNGHGKENVEDAYYIAMYVTSVIVLTMGVLLYITGGAYAAFMTHDEWNVEYGADVERGALWLVKMRRKHVPRFGVVQSSLGRNRYVVASATPPPTRDAGIKRFERYHPHSPKVHRGGGRFVHKRIRSGECERGRVASLTTEFDENCTLWSLPYSTNVSVRSTDTLVEMASFIYNETGMHPYNGSTRVGALIDTGVDATHCSFYDPSHPVSYYTYNGFAMSPPASSHAKIAGYFRLGTGSDFEGDYTDGHGTHVAGIQWGNPCGATRGIDYGARFVFFDASGDVNDQDSLYIPGNLYGIFQTAVNLGASYTSSSWGSDSSGYDGYSYQFDAAANDYELLHVVSAGNSGGPGYIGSPANAKNVVSVGATMVSPDVRPQLGVNYGYRPDLFTRFDVAAFSSYGPTLDGRFGPILAAPGVGIKSSRGIRNSVYAHSDFILMSGTSMAAPGIPSAGLEERLEAAGFSHSSAALRRAFLISATRPMERVVDLWGGVAIEITPTNRAAAGFGILDFDPEFWRGGGNLSAKWSVRDYATVGPSGDTSCFTVPSGSDVVVVLAWTDPPYEPLIASQTTTLVNDLDLHVESRSECRWGNHGNSSDTVNNNEIVRFRSEGGFEETMRVVVSDPFASGQKYALVVYSSGGLVATPCNATCTSHDPPLECDVANGDGYRLCAEGGTWNSTCTPYACLDGYRLSENSTCVALANATAPACLVANGSGRVLDNATCLVTECDEKYAWNGTDCAPTGGVDACVYVSDSFQAPPGLVVSGGEIAHATTMYLALFAFASTCIGA